jgi:DNA-binding transcriptional regulator GbsR (MarR family)
VAIESTNHHGAVARFVEQFASALIEAGFPRMPARVFAALLASDSGRLTAAELAERLGVSPAAISGAVGLLTQVNLVSREREPGSRRDQYRLHDDVWHETMIRRMQVIRRWKSSVQEGIEALGRDTPAGRRLGDTLEFFEFVEVEVPEMLERWRQHKAASRPAEG